MRHVLPTLVAFALAFAPGPAASADGSAPGFTEATAEVGDVRLYYQGHGLAPGPEAPTLLLLHGALEQISAWGEHLTAFAESYPVLAVDTRGHGRSSFVDRPMDYDLLAADMIGLLDHLKIERVHVVGLSDGAITGLHMALRHPDRVAKLVAVGVNFQVGPHAIDEQFLEFFQNMDLDGVAQQATLAYPDSPHPDQMRRMVGRLHTMLLSQPTLTEEDLHGIETPTLIVRGDRDFIKLAHAETMFQALPNAGLSVVPHCSHNVPAERPLLFRKLVHGFLSADTSP